jgi:putative ABC transport system permease protein
VDRSVLAFTLLVAVVVGIFFGLVTVLHTSSIDLNQTLEESARGSLSRAKFRLRAALVVAQVIFALVLLVCAGLTIQGFSRLANVYQGFEPANVLRVELSLPKKTYSDNLRITSFYEQVLQAASLPGVAHASLITNPPASDVDSETTFFSIDGQRALKISEMPSADLQIASSDFFTTLKVGLGAGRTLAESDKSEAPPVAVISRTMAKRFWPAGDALGSRIRLGPQDSAEPWLTIVGILGDVRQNWWNPAARPVIYRPFAQAPQQSMVLLLRTASNPANFTAPVREIVRKLDPGIALNGVSTLESEVADSIAIIRIMGILMGVFGLVALSLSSVGVYGVLSESVAQRTQEIGIRLALGADPRGVMKMILRQALTLTAVGLAFALPLSFAIGRAMGNLIYGVVALNYGVLLGFAVLLLLVAVIAGYVPARRAMRVDPLLSLRYE